MAINRIEIQDNGVLKQQSFKPDPCLNIITGSNGSGKTLLLKSIIDTYSKEHKIKSLLASVQHFKAHPEIEKYNAYIDNDFQDEYKTITKLTNNQDLIADCNQFFSKLGLSIRLNLNNAESGWLLFNNLNHKSKTSIPIDKISAGERTIFILWLLTKNDNKPDVLILDDLDAYLNESLTSQLYTLIVDNFVKNGVQVFLTTNRKAWGQSVPTFKIVNGEILSLQENLTY
jgi:AAA15 family ATPase/GTPase